MNKELNDIDLERIAECVKQGYTSGKENNFTWSSDTNVSDDYGCDNED